MPKLKKLFRREILIKIVIVISALLLIITSLAPIFFLG